MESLSAEFVKRTEASIRNRSLNEYDGKKVADTREWMSKELTLKNTELHTRFKHLFNNVNHQLQQAIERYSKANK